MIARISVSGFSLIAWIYDCKINEVLKSNGKRELNMEEADQVTGGEFRMLDSEHCRVNDGRVMTCAEFNDMIFIICEIYGANTAIDTLFKLTGYTCSEMFIPGHYETEMGYLGVCLLLRTADLTAD